MQYGLVAGVGKPFWPQLQRPRRGEWCAASFGIPLDDRRHILLAVNANPITGFSFTTGGLLLGSEACLVPTGFRLAFWNYARFFLGLIQSTLWDLFHVFVAAILADFTTCSADILYSHRSFAINFRCIWCLRSRLVPPVQFTLGEALGRFIDVHWLSCRLSELFPSLHAYS